MSGTTHTADLPERDDDPVDRTAEYPILELQAVPDAWQLGSVVANRYRLERYLGRGRYGQIYEATDRTLSDPQVSLEHRVALHLLSERISRETPLLRKLEDCYQQPHLWSHPNIVKIRGFGSYEGRYFLATELLDGLPLRAILSDTPGEGLPDKETFGVLRGVGDALKYAHAKGVIHGDIRPEKVFITESYGVKVLDLLPASSARTVPFFVEDAESEALAGPDRRDDVYGLACLAYELLTGRHPYNGNSPLEAWNAQLPLAPIARVGVERWDALARALALRRENRTRTVADFLDDFGLKGFWVLRPDGETTAVRHSASPGQLALSSAAPPATAHTEERSQDAHDEHDDVPLIADYSAPTPAASWPAADRTVPQHTRPQRQPVQPDFDLYVDEHAPQRRAQRNGVGTAAWVGGAVAVAAVGAAATYLYYPPARQPVDEWLSVARTFGEDWWRETMTGDAVDTTGSEAPADGVADVVAPPIATTTPDDAPIDAPTAAALPSDATAASGESGGTDASETDAEPVVPPEPTASSAPEPEQPVPEAETPAVTAVEPLPDAAPPLAAPEPERIEPVSPTVTVMEERGVAAVEVRRRGGTLGESSFVWWTTDDTATAADDYASFGARAETFETGADTHTIYVPIVVDSRPEGRESFHVNVRPTEERGSASDPIRIEVVIVDD